MIEVPEQLFAELAASAAAEYGFTIDPHHFAVLGRCAACGSPPPGAPHLARQAGPRREQAAAPTNRTKRGRA